MPLPDGLSLDAVVDPILERLEREWLPAQPAWVRWSADYAIKSLIDLDLDRYAEEGARQAIILVRDAFSAALDRILKGVPVPLFRVALTKEQGQSLTAAGVNPAWLFFGLQAALFLIQKLMPYLVPTVAMASEGAEPAAVTLALTCDAETLNAVLSDDGVYRTPDVTLAIGEGLKVAD